MRISKVISGKKGELIVEDENGVRIRRTGGTVAWRTNNPGNLKYSPFSIEMGAVGKDHVGHAVFPTKEHGIQAQYVLLFRPNGFYYNLTLRDAIAKYAPSSDNNKPIQYQMYLTKKTGIPHDQKLKTILHDKRLELLEAMQIFEGYKEGKDVKINMKKGTTTKNEETRD